MYIESNDIDKVYKIDINKFINFKLGALLIMLVYIEKDCIDKATTTTTTTKNTLEEGYLENLQKIA